MRFQNTRKSAFFSFPNTHAGPQPRRTALQNRGASEQKTPNTQEGLWPGEDTVAALCRVQGEMGQETKRQCLQKSFLHAARTAARFVITRKSRNANGSWTGSSQRAGREARGQLASPETKVARTSLCRPREPPHIPSSLPNPRAQHLHAGISQHPQGLQAANAKNEGELGAEGL